MTSIVCPDQALKMVLERETWLKMSSDTLQVVSFAGLVGDGAAIIVPTAGYSAKAQVLHSRKSPGVVDGGNQKNGFTQWVRMGNPFSIKLMNGSKEHLNSSNSVDTVSGSSEEKILDSLSSDKLSPQNSDSSHINGKNSVSEDENEDLLADFIDEDSQLPSRISKPKHSRSRSSHWNEADITAQTGSSLCLLRCVVQFDFNKMPPYSVKFDEFINSG